MDLAHGAKASVRPNLDSIGTVACWRLGLAWRRKRRWNLSCAMSSSLQPCLLNVFYDQLQLSDFDSDDVNASDYVRCLDEVQHSMTQPVLSVQTSASQWSEPCSSLFLLAWCLAFRRMSVAAEI